MKQQPKFLPVNTLIQKFDSIKEDNFSDSDKEAEIQEKTTNELK